MSLGVNFNESLTNDVVSFEQLGPVLFACKKCIIWNCGIEKHELKVNRNHVWKWQQRLPFFLNWELLSSLMYQLLL